MIVSIIAGLIISELHSKPKVRLNYNHEQTTKKNFHYFYVNLINSNFVGDEYNC
jgi:hypothetical protein